MNVCTFLVKLEGEMNSSRDVGQELTRKQDRLDQVIYIPFKMHSDTNIIRRFINSPHKFAVKMPLHFNFARAPLGDHLKIIGKEIMTIW